MTTATTLDLHVHTCYSFDCRTQPRELIDHACRNNLSAIAITDHDSIEGALVVQAMRPPFKVIVGCEITLVDGSHLIGLFLERPIRPGMTFADTADAVHLQGGLVLLPHPFRSETGILSQLDGPSDVRGAIPQVDLIEVFNAKSSPDENARAVALARQAGIPATAGSDAHRPKEIGRGIVVLQGTTAPGLRTALLGNARVMHGIRQKDAEVASRVLGEQRIKRLCLRAKPVVPVPLWNVGRRGWDTVRNLRDRHVQWPMTAGERFEALPDRIRWSRIRRPRRHDSPTQANNLSGAVATGDVTTESKR